MAHVIDGENNRTAYIYDGHDRVNQTRYPLPTKGANSANTSDYEQLAYDPNSNFTRRRLDMLAKDSRTIRELKPFEDRPPIHVLRMYMGASVEPRKLCWLRV